MNVYPSFPIAELYEFNDEPMSARPTPVVPEDRWSFFSPSFSLL